MDIWHQIITNHHSKAWGWKTLIIPNQKLWKIMMPIVMKGWWPWWITMTMASFFGSIDQFIYEASDDIKSLFAKEYISSIGIGAGVLTFTLVKNSVNLFEDGKYIKTIKE